VVLLLLKKGTSKGTKRDGGDGSLAVCIQSNIKKLCGLEDHDYHLKEGKDGGQLRLLVTGMTG